METNNNEIPVTPVVEPIANPVPETTTIEIIRDEKGRIVKPIPQDTNKNGTAGRPTVIDEMVILKLEEAFSWGCTDLEACLNAGISKSTLYLYQKDHPEFSVRKEELKENPVLLARGTVVKAMQNDPKLSWDFLQKKKYKEFKTGIESSEKSIGGIKINIIRSNGATNNTTPDSGNQPIGETKPSTGSTGQ